MGHMHELDNFVEKPRPCSYLAGRQAALEHRILLDVSPEDLGRLLSRGWRRFGPEYFRPACASCHECVSLRVPVGAFTATRSQLRALQRSERFRVAWGVPRLDEERLALYGKWHAEREESRQWQSSEMDADAYAMQFAFPHAAAREFSWRNDEGRLVAVGLVDETPIGLSAVYFFYHPEIARLSPGVANVLRCIDMAARLGLPHVYLGYRVEGCASLVYKAQYRPHELLVGRPSSDEVPTWAASAPAGSAGGPDARKRKRGD